jgi:uncharacterized Zn finger protein (UPF0148 family)
MAETFVENKICKSCGAEIRTGALFCYSCGKSVKQEAEVALKEKKNVSNAWFREDLTKTAEENGNKSLQQKESVNSKEIVEAPTPEPLKTDADTKLKSAAAMRRKSKIYQPKKIEIVWEEHDNPPNGWFIAAAIALTLLAAGIFYLAIYLK